MLTISIYLSGVRYLEDILVEAGVHPLPQRVLLLAGGRPLAEGLVRDVARLQQLHPARERGVCQQMAVPEVSGTY